MGGGGTMGRNFDMSQYQAATRKRTGVSALLIFWLFLSAWLHWEDFWEAICT